MEIKIYKTEKEVMSLTERLAKELADTTAIAINSANLVARLPKSIISPAYQEIRPQHVEDSSKYHLSGLLTKDNRLFLSVYHPGRMSPVIFELSGDELKVIPK